MGLILNAAIFLLEAVLLYMCFKARKLANFVYYTQLSNMLCALSCLLYVLFGPLSWVTDIRYLAACAVTMTFLVTTCVLIPMGGSAEKLLLRGNGPFHHVLCPLLCVISYIFFEAHAGADMIAASMGITFLYGIIMLILNCMRKVDGPYPFFRVYNQPVYASVFWVIALTALIGVISWAVFSAAGLVL